VVSGMTQFDGSGYGEIRSPMQKGVHPVLIEVNFHDNPITAQYIIDNKDAITGAVVKAITATLGIAKKATPASPVPDSEKPSDWAAEAWAWAKANGITDGTNPRGNITREQVATMLWRYNRLK